MNQCESKFFGKYRGKVKDNKDPLKLGRLKIIAPSVLGKNESWAMPSVPYAGKKVGFFALPPKDANVWIEFEAGDIDHPIWTGCFWEKDEIPADPPEEKMKVFKTDSFSLILDDTKSFTLELSKPVMEKPLKLVFEKSGIKISNENTASGIEITSGGTSVKLEDKKTTVKSEEVGITSGGTSVKLEDKKTTVKSDEVGITSGSTSVKLEKQKAAIKSSKVDINDGALEVI